MDYQGRNRRKTNLAPDMSEPLAGNHTLNDIEVQFEVVTPTLENSGIDVAELFLKADVGFDSKDFRMACAVKEINTHICFNKRNWNVERDEYFYQKLYEQRYTIEPTNAWMDSFRSLLNSCDTTTKSW